MREQATPPVLSIITANWNTRERIGELLTSIYTHLPEVPFEVIVVDNGSHDGSGELIKKSFPDVTLIENGSNHGYAKANNQGFTVARGKFILLLGSDTIITKGSLQALVDFLASHEGIGAVAPRLRSPDGSTQESNKRFPRLRDGFCTYLSLHCLARRYNMRGFDYATTAGVHQPPATCLMIRREVIDEIGGLFDETYTILYNDVDLCRRMWNHGHTIMYVGHIAITHHGSYSTRRATPAVRLEMYKNILRYYHHHSGARAIVLLLPVLLIRLFIVNKGRCTLGLLSFGYLK